MQLAIHCASKRYNKGIRRIIFLPFIFIKIDLRKIGPFRQKKLISHQWGNRHPAAAWTLFPHYFHLKRMNFNQKRTAPGVAFVTTAQSRAPCHGQRTRAKKPTRKLCLIPSDPRTYSLFARTQHWDAKHALIPFRELTAQQSCVHALPGCVKTAPI